MDDIKHAVEQDEYRVVLLLPSSRYILTPSDKRSRQLPVALIPRWERPAQQLTQFTKSVWKLDTILIDILMDAPFLTPCAVLEVRPKTGHSVQGQFCPTPLEAIDEASLGNEERRTIEAILSGESNGRGPFSRTGWITEASAWISDAVRRRNERPIDLSDEIIQLNASGSFALIRFGTRVGPAYWLKATGTPNEREFTITTTLSELLEEFVPPLIDCREDWNAWITEEVGCSLFTQAVPRSFERAVVSLAALQKSSMRCQDRLLSAGCSDQSLERIADGAKNLFEYLDVAMAKQASTKVPRLDHSRLVELRNHICDACSRMSELHLPKALMHNDVGFGNILLDDDRCVFTDWAEAAVGNPFLTFEQFYARVCQNSQEDIASSSYLRTLYKRQWLDTLPEATIDLTLALSPLLAITSYIYGRGTPIYSISEDNPRLERHMRGLARHMDRAARTPEFLGAIR
jgi:hypothetical protein